tara:strand:- start:595 stop:1047 length:453 start_codon:yes stop_codon:yes gene_type:complete
MTKLTKTLILIFSTGFVIGIILTTILIYLYMKYMKDNESTTCDAVKNEEEMNKYYIVEDGKRSLNYDCTSKVMWTPEKKQWCKDKGEWFDCRTKEKFSPEKEKWCTNNMNRMCPQHIDPVCDIDSMTEYSNICKAPNIIGKYQRGKCVQE